MKNRWMYLDRRQTSQYVGGFFQDFLENIINYEIEQLRLLVYVKQISDAGFLDNQK